MGFDWGATVSVEFTQQISMPLNVARFAKRLIEWNLVPGTNRSTRHAKKQKTSIVMVGNTLPNSPVEVESDDDEFGWCFSECDEDALDEDRVDLLQRLKHETGSSYHADASFDLVYNRPEILTSAFALAADRLLGAGHEIKLEFDHGGCRGEATGGASYMAMRLVYKKPIVPGSGIDVPRGGVNIPWGVKATAIPRMSVEEEAAGRSSMARACAAFGLEAVGDAGWHLVTVASGG